VPDIRYAKSGGAAIAYHVVGDADADLVYVPDYVSNLVYAWDSPYWRGFYERLARSFRLILFDKRGTGLSDSGAQFATLETRMEDVGAVLDAVGAERAVVLAGHEGCGMASLYAATYPERVNALVLFQPGWGASDEEADRAPTLVLYRGAHMEEDSLELARRIPSAHAVRLAGEDYWGPFLSPEIVDEIERFVAGEPVAVVPDSILATVMFTDIVGSTERAAELGDEAWRNLLADHNALVRRELARYRGEERDTAGDGFFATFDGPARAIRCAQAIVEGLRRLGLEVRIGIHAGECERLEAKLGGIAVSIGARIGGLAGPGEVLVSGTVKDLVAGSGLEFEARGSHELKGVPGEWRLYAVRDS
jgi:class 3 adenylate cyclase